MWSSEAAAAVAAAIEAAYIYCKYTEAASVAASMRLCSTSSLYTTIRRSSRGPSSSRNDELAAPTAAVEAAAAALRPDG